MAETAPGRFARNSLASLLRTLSGAFLAVLLPPLLLRRLGPDAYGVWAIAVEIATYLSLLDLGALSAIGHFAAKADAMEGKAGHGRVVATMLALQVGLALVGALLLGGLVLAMPAIFSRMPRGLVPDGRWTMALIGGSALLGLLATGVTGYFLSIHRVVVPASITFVSRLFGAAVVAGLAIQGHGIATLALAWAVCTVVGYLLIGVAYAKLRIPTRPSLVSRDLAGQMVQFAGAYGLWTLASLLILGLDTTIVARLDFKAVAPYAAAAGMASVVTAVYGSALAPLVPLAARLSAAGERDELARTFLRLIRLGGLGVAVLSAVGALAAAPLFRIWIGGTTARQGIPLLQLLIAANGVRLLLQPYPALVFGTGEHRRVRFQPMIEGVVNVAASIGLGLWIGPKGVALGSLIGAFVGVTVHLFVSIPRTASMGLDGPTVLREGLRRPMIAAAPAFVAFGLRPLLPTAAWPPLATVAVLATVVLAVTGLAPEDRAVVGRVVRRVRRIA